MHIVQTLQQWNASCFIPCFGIFQNRNTLFFPFSQYLFFIANQVITAFSILHGETYTQKLGLSSHNMLPVVTEARENSLRTADKGCGFELVSMETL